MIIQRIARIVLPAALVGITSVGLRGQTLQGPPTAGTPYISQIPEYPQTPGEPPTTSPAEPEAPSSPFNYGLLELHPDLSYQIAYETGLQATPGKAVDVTVQTLSAGIVVQEGTAWNLTYTPSWVRYSSSLFDNTVDQDAKLGANFTYQDWEIALSQSYNRSSEPLIETGRQTQQQMYDTYFDAHYGASISKPSLEMVFRQDIRFASFSPSVYDWNNQDWIHFPVSPQFDFAIGPGGGYTHENPGFDMVYTRPEVRVIWKPTEKLSLDAQGGFQETTILVADREHYGTSTFSSNLIYQPWPTTSVSAGANRQSAASYVADELNESTTFDVQLRQRLLGHYFLSLQAGSGETDYLSTNSALASARSDNTNSVEVSLNTVIFNHVSLGLTASHVHNSSSVSGFGLTTGQYGFQAALRY